MDKLKNAFKFELFQNDDSSSVITSSDATSSSGNAEPKTFREKLLHVLHSTEFQVAVVILVIVDCILVVFELLIDLGGIKLCEEAVRAECESAGTTATMTPAEEAEKEAECDHPAPEILHYMSIAILTIFLIEIMFKVYAYQKDYLKHKMELFDAVVVIISFCFDVAYANHEDAFDGIGLLVVLRLWRVTRIINGILMSVQHTAEKKINAHKQARQEVQEELNKMIAHAHDLEKEIDLLRKTLRENGISVESIPRTPEVSSSQVKVEAEITPTTEYATPAHFSAFSGQDDTQA
ncbi:PREDICTED: voltage-gated hydrogen channel 1-like [Branchiostoma belcheri]|uniref:Voltage-gated hydrogen channel 1 n=1 Tax=Branchiostoma belcheri TaxID=7741 RepID=A0A6P4YJF3_BRABE|nr:PREDICTED: voltage-gated hydrogen channel 1-like [Branchiostoma belcheri]